jgi:hypothetical protein
VVVVVVVAMKSFVRFFEFCSAVVARRLAPYFGSIKLYVFCGSGSSAIISQYQSVLLLLLLLLLLCAEAETETPRPEADEEEEEVRCGRGTEAGGGNGDRHGRQDLYIVTVLRHSSNAVVRVGVMVRQQSSNTDIGTNGLYEYIMHMARAAIEERSGPAPVRQKEKAASCASSLP